MIKCKGDRIFHFQQSREKEGEGSRSRAEARCGEGLRKERTDQMDNSEPGSQEDMTREKFSGMRNGPLVPGQ